MSELIPFMQQIYIMHHSGRQPVDGFQAKEVATKDHTPIQRHTISIMYDEENERREEQVESRGP